MVEQHYTKAAATDHEHWPLALHVFRLRGPASSACLLMLPRINPSECLICLSSDSN